MKLTWEESDLELLRASVESANDAIIITDTQLDPPGPKIVYVNPAFTRMTGYTYEETIGKTPRILQGKKNQSATSQSPAI
jgi:PAS domain S-box-containing protein